MEHAVTAALKLVEHQDRREAMAEAAQAFASANRGAAQRTAAAVLSIAEAAPVPVPVAAEERTEPNFD